MDWQRCAAFVPVLRVPVFTFTFTTGENVVYKLDLHSGWVRVANENAAADNHPVAH